MDSVDLDGVAMTSWEAFQVKKRSQVKLRDEKH